MAKNKGKKASSKSTGGADASAGGAVTVEDYKEAVMAYVDAMGDYIEEAASFAQDPSKPPENYVAAKEKYAQAQAVYASAIAKYESIPPQKEVPYAQAAHDPNIAEVAKLQSAMNQLNSGLQEVHKRCDAIITFLDKAPEVIKDAKRRSEANGPKAKSQQKDLYKKHTKFLKSALNKLSKRAQGLGDLETKIQAINQKLADRESQSTTAQSVKKTAAIERENRDAAIKNRLAPSVNVELESQKLADKEVQERRDSLKKIEPGNTEKLREKFKPKTITPVVSAEEKMAARIQEAFRNYKDKQKAETPENKAEEPQTQPTTSAELASAGSTTETPENKAEAPQAEPTTLNFGTPPSDAASSNLSVGGQPPQTSVEQTIDELTGVKKVSAPANATPDSPEEPQEAPENVLDGSIAQEAMQESALSEEQEYDPIDPDNQGPGNDSANIAEEEKEIEAAEENQPAQEDELARMMANPNQDNDPDYDGYDADDEEELEEDKGRQLDDEIQDELEKMTVNEESHPKRNIKKTPRRKAGARAGLENAEPSTETDVETLAAASEQQAAASEQPAPEKEIEQFVSDAELENAARVTQKEDHEAAMQQDFVPGSPIKEPQSKEAAEVSQTTQQEITPEEKASASQSLQDSVDAAMRTADAALKDVQTLTKQQEHKESATKHSPVPDDDTTDKKIQELNTEGINPEILKQFESMNSEVDSELEGLGNGSTSPGSDLEDGYDSDNDGLDEEDINRANESLDALKQGLGNAATEQKQNPNQIQNPSLESTEDILKGSTVQNAMLEEQNTSKKAEKRKSEEIDAGADQGPNKKGRIDNKHPADVAAEQAAAAPEQPQTSQQLDTRGPSDDGIPIPPTNNQQGPMDNEEKKGPTDEGQAKETNQSKIVGQEDETKTPNPLMDAITKANGKPQKSAQTPGEQTEAASETVPGGAKPSLMDEIKAGRENLKSAANRKTPETPTPEKKSMKEKLAERRKKMGHDDDEEEIGGDSNDDWDLDNDEPKTPGQPTAETQTPAHKTAAQAEAPPPAPPKPNQQPATQPQQQGAGIMLDQINKGVQLKKVDAPATPTKIANSNLLDQIQKGKDNLKKPEMPPTAATPNASEGIFANNPVLQKQQAQQEAQQEAKEQQSAANGIPTPNDEAVSENEWEDDELETTPKAAPETLAAADTPPGPETPAANADTPPAPETHAAKASPAEPKTRPPLSEELKNAIHQAAENRQNKQAAANAAGQAAAAAPPPEQQTEQEAAQAAANATEPENPNNPTAQAAAETQTPAANANPPEQGPNKKGRIDNKHPADVAAEQAAAAPEQPQTSQQLDTRGPSDDGIPIPPTNNQQGPMDNEEKKGPTDEGQAKETNQSEIVGQGGKTKTPNPLMDAITKANGKPQKSAQTPGEQTEAASETVPGGAKPSLMDEIKAGRENLKSAADRKIPETPTPEKPKSIKEELAESLAERRKKMGYDDDKEIGGDSNDWDPDNDEPKTPGQPAAETQNPAANANPPEPEAAEQEVEQAEQEVEQAAANATEPEAQQAEGEQQTPSPEPEQGQTLAQKHENMISQRAKEEKEMVDKRKEVELEERTKLSKEREQVSGPNITAHEQAGRDAAEARMKEMNDAITKGKNEKQEFEQPANAAPTTDPAAEPKLEPEDILEGSAVQQAMLDDPTAKASDSVVLGTPPDQLGTRGNQALDPITEAIREEILRKQQILLRDTIATQIKDEAEKQKVQALKQPELRDYLGQEENKKHVAAAMKDPKLKTEMQKIESAGYTTVKTQFASKFHDVPWQQTEQTRSSEIKNAAGEKVCDLSETTMSASNLSPNGIISYRKIDFPTALDKPNGPMHLTMALQDKNGQNMPEDGAVYFTAHYDEAGKLTEVSSPIPVQFMGDDDNAIGYIEKDGQIYTLPITQGNYKEMMLEVSKNQGLGVNISQNIDVERSKDRVVSGPEATSQEQRTLNEANTPPGNSTLDEATSLAQEGKEQVDNADEALGTTPSPKAVKDVVEPDVQSRKEEMHEELKRKQAEKEELSNAVADPQNPVDLTQGMDSPKSQPRKLSLESLESQEFESPEQSRVDEDLARSPTPLASHSKSGSKTLPPKSFHTPATPPPPPPEKKNEVEPASPAAKPNSPGGKTTSPGGEEAGKPEMAAHTAKIQASLQGARGRGDPSGAKPETDEISPSTSPNALKQDTKNGRNQGSDGHGI